MCKHKFKECSMKGVPLEVIYKELGNSEVRVSPRKMSFRLMSPRKMFLRLLSLLESLN